MRLFSGFLAGMIFSIKENIVLADEFVAKKLDKVCMIILPR